MNDFDHPYLITHDLSGDEAEADSRDAAWLAARTLLEDNDYTGGCRIREAASDAVLDIVWAERTGDSGVCWIHLQQGGGGD